MSPFLQKDILRFPPLYQLLNNLYKYNYREPFYRRKSSQTDHQEEKYAVQFGGKGCSLKQVSYWTDTRRFFCLYKSLLVHQINKTVLKRTGQKNNQAGREYATCKSTEAQPIAYKKQEKKNKIPYALI